MIACVNHIGSKYHESRRESGGKQVSDSGREPFRLQVSAKLRALHFVGRSAQACRWVCRLVCRWFVAGLSLTEIAQNHAKIAQNCDFGGFEGLTE
jgi:hypothetical protein